MSGMNWCVKVSGEGDRLTDRPADRRELGIGEYDSARE